MVEIFVTVNFGIFLLVLLAATLLLQKVAVIENIK